MKQTRKLSNCTKKEDGFIFAIIPLPKSTLLSIKMEIGRTTDAQTGLRILDLKTKDLRTVCKIKVIKRHRAHFWVSMHQLDNLSDFQKFLFCFQG